MQRQHKSQQPASDPERLHLVRPSPWPRRIVIFLAIWTAAVSGLILVAVWKNPVQRAVLGMAWGLILIWIGGCGLAFWRLRNPINEAARHVKLPWGIKFVLGSTLLACTEEAITTSMTNAAPLFGVELGQAYITASANYFDVILYHSVVVFVPMFIGWALLLRWWKFTPFAVFLLFGITGLLAETLTFGPQNLGNFAFWILVYGLMVWIPAHWAPEHRHARVPAWWAYPLAVIFPTCLVPLAYVLAPWLWLTAKHPPIHFPPIGGN